MKFHFNLPLGSELIKRDRRRIRYTINFFSYIIRNVNKREVIIAHIRDNYTVKKTSRNKKAVPLHAMEALRGEGV
jgi:hypothetical protein